jgi:hypothetical protein
VRSLVFVLVFVLLQSSVAQAKIEVRGDEGFKDQASQALEDIKRTTPKGQSLVTALETSKHTHVIRRTNAAVDWNVPHRLNEASNGVGAGSTTRWNPNSKKPYADGVNRDPIAALFHELCHALEADRGVWGGSLDPATGIRKSEIQAIRTENSYRRAKGLPERTKYGQQDLPQIRAEILAETSPNEPPSDGLICKEDVDLCAADAVVPDAGAGHAGCEEGDWLNAP